MNVCQEEHVRKDIMGFEIGLGDLVVYVQRENNRV